MKKEEKIALIANNKKSAQERVDEMYEQLDFYGIEPSEPVKLVNIENLTREEWLVWRRKGFGGSDAGTVIGLAFGVKKAPMKALKRKIPDDEVIK